MNTSKPKQSDLLKILFLDIETAPNLGYTWGKYEQNVIQFTQESYMLCFTAKWAHEKKPIIYCLRDMPGYEKDKKSDLLLVKKLWELLDEADIVVAHNGDAFDIKKTNTRFAVNGLGPPSPYRTVDTKKLAKRYFMFNSNKLDDLGKILNLGEKLPTGGFQLWVDCMEGKKAAWSKMKQYNKQDVLLLEKVYDKLKIWMTNHPHVGINISRDCCHHCGSSSTQKRGFSYTRFTKYQRYQCLNCGSWSQGSAIKISK